MKSTPPWRRGRVFLDATLQFATEMGAWWAPAFGLHPALIERGNPSESVKDDTATETTCRDSDALLLSATPLSSAEQRQWNMITKNAC